MPKHAKSPTPSTSSPSSARADRMARRSPPPVKGIFKTSSARAQGPRVRYHYAWRGGPKFWSSLDDIPEGGPAYWEAYTRACEGARADRGRFREVLTKFLRSPEYQRYAPATQKEYRHRIFRAKRGIEPIFGDLPLAVFNTRKIREITYAWLDTYQSDKAADEAKKALTRIVRWAVDRNLIAENHVKGIPNRYKADRAEILWTPEEIARLYHAAPPHLQRVIVLMTEAGVAPVDAIALTRTNILPGPNGHRRLRLRRSKTAALADIPVTAALSRMIDATPEGQDHLIVGRRGRPYRQANSLSHAIGDLKKATKGIRDELNFYDLRGVCVTRLVRVGARLDQIATHMGWSMDYASRMLDVYTALEGVDSSALIDKLDAQTANVWCKRAAPRDEKEAASA